MTLQELSALTQLIQKTLMTGAEQLWVQALFSRLAEEITRVPSPEDEPVTDEPTK